MLISGRLQTRGESILSEADEIKTMLLHLHIVGQIDTTNWSMRKYRLFNKAFEKDYIKPICLNDMHYDDWDWAITKKGLKYLERSR
jgi:hypothetical protein